MILSICLPIIISILFIVIVNWCALKEEEYPNIKIINKKKTFIIIFLIGFLSNLLTLYFINNIYLQIIINLALIILCPLSYIDWKTSLIPNRLSFGIFSIGVLNVLFNYLTKGIYTNQNVSEQVISFIVITICFFLLYFICRGGVGMGDVKLISSLSLFMTLNDVCFLLFISSALIVVYNAIINIVFRKKIEELPDNNIKLSDEEEKIEGRVCGISIINNKPSIVMGPFISLAFLITMLFSEPFFLWLWG